MSLEDIARQLSDPSRVGMTPELVEKLKLKSVDATRGQLMAAGSGDAGPTSVHLLAMYVIDDTDFWDRGEIYWWAIPTIVNEDGSASWSPLTGLPTGAAPIKVGSKEWMSSLDLKNQPLVAVIPADDAIAKCVIRLGVYDDDRAPADVPGALTAALDYISTFRREGLSGPDELITPIRSLIWKHLRAEQDDMMVDEDLTIARSGSLHFQCGFVGSVNTGFARVYYVVKDAARTEQLGPFDLTKNDTKTVQFTSEIQQGGRVSILSQGDASTSLLGELNLDNAYASKIVDAGLAASLKNGLTVSTTKKPARFVVFYTPPPGG